ncbi:MAG TPA: FtsQ-type POTRA domain-containing protein [Acidimicrobiales bacterium]|nr:FtsQ-type POTRA domain-containing protein [Acidimicrobiales bacterium]
MSQVTMPPRQDDGPRVDPRFRKRWADARRAEGRRRLRVVTVVAAVVVVVGAGIGALYSPLLRVRDVVVVGNTHTPRAEVLAAAGLLPQDPSTPMVDVEPAKAQHAVQSLPWVGSATFERRWPWTVVIKVKERAPVALLVTATAIDEVDVTGRVLEVRTRAAGPGKPASEPAGTVHSAGTGQSARTGPALPSLPMVTGARSALAGAEITPEHTLSGPNLQALLEAAAATPPALAERRLVLGYSPEAGLVAYEGWTGTLVLLGDASDLAFKLAVLEELASRVGLSGYSQVDLTVPQRPALTARTTSSGEAS